MTARGTHERDALTSYVCNDQTENLLTGSTLPFRAFQKGKVEPRAEEAEGDAKHEEECESGRHTVRKWVLIVRNARDYPADAHHHSGADQDGDGENAENQGVDA